MQVLLSIKPEFAERIFAGSKKYEFRKVIFRRTGIEKVIVYASSPVQLVIGEFEIDSILEDSPQRIWEIAGKESGVSESFFFEYFSKNKTGFAIKIKQAQRYERPYCLRKVHKMSPPQSFCYL